MEQSITPGKLQKWCSGEWLVHNHDTPVDELVIDSRKIAQAEHALFIALKSQRRDGHSFIESAYSRGIRNFLVSEAIDLGSYPEANFIKVKDTLRGLQL